jgi:phosphoglycerol transferase
VTRREPDTTDGYCAAVRRPATTSNGRALLLDAVLVAVAAVLILVPVLELWDADIGVPLASTRSARGVYAFEPDAPFYQMLAKGGIDHAWFLTNSNLGAPYHQQLFDFPISLDNFNLVGLKVLGTVTGSVGATVNIFFVLTFVAVAVSMLLVLRALGVSRMVAFVVALLYTFVPYHFARGEPHLFLSTYWVVPLASYLVLRVVSASPPFTTEADNDAGWRVQLANRSGILWLLACIPLASSGAYYAAFTLMFLIVLTAVDFIARRRRRVVASGAIAVAAIAAVGLFNVLPTLVYWGVHGTNSGVVRRSAGETEYEGLKLSQLVIPAEKHRIKALSDLQAQSMKKTPTRSEPGQQLGVIGAIGFLALLVILAVSIRRPRSRGGNDHEPQPSDRAGPVPPPSDALLTMGVMTVTAVVVGVISGFSLIIFGLGVRDLRSWNRISIFIAFFALTVVAYGLDWVRRRMGDKRGAAPLFAAALVVVLAVGILDQTTPAAIPDYRATQARWASDAHFVSQLEQKLPKGAQVFELPYEFFPEMPQVAELGPYDLVRLYLHSDDLNWSFGGMSGREADWQASTARLFADRMLPRLAAVGYDGIVYDVGAQTTEDNPTPDDITATIHQRPVISRDGEWAFWDLRPLRRELRAQLGADGVRRLRAEALADRSRKP